MRHLKNKNRWASRLAVTTLVVAALGLAVVGWRRSASAQQEVAIVADDSPLLREPTTVTEYFDAVQLMLKIARADWAKRYLDAMVALNPSDEELLALRDVHGPAIFLRISGHPDLQPTGSQLSAKVNRLFRIRGEDPVRVNQLIDTIVNGSTGKAQVAQLSLNGLGVKAVPIYISRMIAADLIDTQAALIGSLADIGEVVVEPLVAALEAEDPKLRSMVIQTLGLIRSRDAVVNLWFHAYGPDQPAGVQSSARDALSNILQTKVGSTVPDGIADELHQQSLRHLRSEMPSKAGDDEGNVSLWTWVPEQSNVKSIQVKPKEARLYHATHFAKQAFEYDSDNPTLQAHYLATALAYESRNQTWEDGFATGPGTAYELALTSGNQAVRDALDVALRNSSAVAAMGFLKVLGQIGTEHDLTGTKQAPSPVLVALNYPDHRVQFVAALTVLELNPTQSFSGSNRVVSIIARAMIDDMTRRVVVIDPNPTRGRDMTAYFNELGYDPVYAATGKTGFKTVVERSDISLIALNVNTVRWDLSETIANFRADARTAQIPITIYGPERTEPDVANLCERYAPLNYVVDPAGSRGLQVQLNPFLEKLNIEELTTEQREARATAASHSLAHIAVARQDGIFKLQGEEKTLVAAVNDPLVAPDVIVALRAIPTPKVQQTLNDLATQESLPVELRINAAEQLAFHIHQYGLLLPLEGVSRLEVTWRNSSNPELSTALAAVVGSLKPNQKRIGGRLKRYRRPALSGDAPASP